MKKKEVKKVKDEEVVEQVEAVTVTSEKTELERYQERLSELYKLEKQLKVEGIRSIGDLENKIAKVISDITKL